MSSDSNDAFLDSVSVSSDEGQNFSQFGDPLAATATSVTVTGLNPSTVYLFEVTANNSAGDSYAAGPIGAKTAAVPADVNDVTSLSAAAGPSSMPWNSATLTWAGGPTDNSNIEFEQKDLTTGENYHDVNTIAILSYGTAYAEFLNLGDSYKFRVRYDRPDGTVSPWQEATYNPSLLSAPVVNVTETTDSGGVGHLVVGWQGAPTDGTVRVQVMGDALPDAGWIRVIGNSDGGENISVTTNAANVPVPGDQGCTTDPGLVDHSGNYYFRVQGFSSTGQPTAWSEPEFGTLGTLTAPAVTQTHTTDSVTLTVTGTAAAGTTTEFQYCYTETKPGGITSDFGISSFYELGVVDAGQSSTSLTSTVSAEVDYLDPGATYHFLVIEFQNGQYVQLPTYQIDATTDGAVVPTSPQNLGVAWSASAGGVALNWADESNNETGFKIQRSDLPFPSDGSTLPTAADLRTFTVGADVSSYVDTNAGPDSKYFYRVCATGDSSGNYDSAYTQPVTVDTPGVSIVVGTTQLDPAFNPEIPLESTAVPVVINVPLGAEKYGSATLTWSSKLKLFSDALMSTQLGTGGNSTTWAVSSPLTSQTFYVEGIDGSSTYGDQNISVTTALHLYSAAEIIATPTLQQVIAAPAATQPLTPEGVVVITGSSFATFGTDLSGVPNLNAVVGQRMTFLALWKGPEPAPSLDLPVTWTVNGAAQQVLDFFVGGGGNVGAAIPLDLSRPIPYMFQLNFIWSKASINGDLEQIKCTIHLHEKDWTSPVVRIDAASPEATIDAVTGNTSYLGQQVTSNGSNGRITIGDKTYNYVDSGTLVPDGSGFKDPGIAFFGYSKEPFSKTGGQYEWIQVISSKTIHERGLLNYHNETDLFGLDGECPFQKVNKVYRPSVPGVTGDLSLVKPTTADSPLIGSSLYSTVSETVVATMYLMYEPAGAGPNDWVPLSSVKWTWTGSVADGRLLENNITAEAPVFQPDYPNWGKKYPKKSLLGN